MKYLIIFMFCAFPLFSEIPDNYIDEIWAEAQHKKAESVKRYKTNIENRYLKQWVIRHKKEIEAYVDSLEKENVYPDGATGTITIDPGYNQWFGGHFKLN